MDGRARIPALALLGLSLTDCTGDTADPIVGDWRAIQVDGTKHPMRVSYYGESVVVGEQLRIDDDLTGEFAAYQEADADGLHYEFERASALVVDAAGAPNYRIEVAHDLLKAPYNPYDSEDVPGDPDSDGDAGSYAIPDADHVPLRPLTAPTTPDLAPAELVFTCTLDQDILTCDREGPGEGKHWVFERIRPEED